MRLCWSFGVYVASAKPFQDDFIYKRSAPPSKTKGLADTEDETLLSLDSSQSSSAS
jgi:hypothetical protein